MGEFLIKSDCESITKTHLFFSHYVLFSFFQTLAQKFPLSQLFQINSCINTQYKSLDTFSVKTTHHESEINLQN